MLVWTIDRYGVKKLTVILKATKREVPQGHKMVHLVLADGREILASPKHPLADGRIFAHISQGDIVDGSKVITAELVSYRRKATYDLLPSGYTGLYWANGILVKSTILT